VPVLGVRARGRADGADDLGERVGAGRLPEADGAGAKVDVVREVVPRVGRERRRPVRVRGDVPAQEGVGCAGLAADEAELDLGEVALRRMGLSVYSVVTCGAGVRTSKNAIWCSKPGFGAFVDEVESEKW
jgi:hypothetical protein